jgi:uncharacterized repeat protein (TIGR01451 family)
MSKSKDSRKDSRNDDHHDDHDDCDKPSLNITKTVTDVGGDGESGSVDAAGDVITYQVVLSNEGDVDLTGVTLSDSLVSVVGNAVETGGTGTNGDGILDVGETWTYSYTYTATQADIDSNGGGDGDIDNTATADSCQTKPESASAAVPVVQEVPARAEHHQDERLSAFGLYRCGIVRGTCRWATRSPTPIQWPTPARRI